MNLLGNFEAQFAEGGEGADRAHYSVEQDVPVSALFRDVEPDATAAQSLVGSNFALFGAKCARENHATGSVCHASDKEEPPVSYVHF